MDKRSLLYCIVFLVNFPLNTDSNLHCHHFCLCSFYCIAPSFERQQPLCQGLPPHLLSLLAVPWSTTTPVVGRPVVGRSAANARRVAVPSPATTSSMVEETSKTTKETATTTAPTTSTVSTRDFTNKLVLLHTLLSRHLGVKEFVSWWKDKKEEKDLNWDRLAILFGNLSALLSRDLI